LEYINSIFLLHWLNSPEGVKKSLDNIYGRNTSQGNLNVNQVRAFIIPIPPLNEQNRIVAKVDELMALCDQLETQLNTTETDSRRLLEAVLHEALAPVLKEAA
jgi:type I restriction enzyme, S subunit